METDPDGVADTVVDTFVEEIVGAVIVALVDAVMGRHGRHGEESPAR